MLSQYSFAYPNVTGHGFGWPAERGLSSGNADISRPYEWPSQSPIENLKWLIEEGLNQYPEQKNILFSSELLSRYAAKSDFWKSLAEIRQKHGCDIEVVAYFRDPFQTFISGYQQDVKFNAFAGSLGDYLDYFWSDGKSEMFTLHKHISSAIESSQRFNIQFKTFRYEEIENGIEQHFLDQVLGLPASVIVNSPQYVNKSMRVEDIHFLRGVNSISPQLGVLLGFERGDLHLGAIRPTRQSNLKLELGIDEQRALLDLFSMYRLQAQKVLPFADRIEFGIRQGKIVTELDSKDSQLVEELFNAGVFVAASYEGGYIKWGWETNFKK